MFLYKSVTDYTFINVLELFCDLYGIFYASESEIIKINFTRKKLKVGSFFVVCHSNMILSQHNFAIAWFLLTRIYYFPRNSLFHLAPFYLFEFRPAKMQ